MAQRTTVCVVAHIYIYKAAQKASWVQHTLANVCLSHVHPFARKRPPTADEECWNQYFTIINPRCAFTARVTVLGSWVCLSVCPLPRFLRQDNEIATPTGSSLHWPHFKEGNFDKTSAFKSYGVKGKWTSQLQIARLTLTMSACSVHFGGTRSHNGKHVSTFASYLLLQQDSPRANAY